MTKEQMRLFDGQAEHFAKDFSSPLTKTAIEIGKNKRSFKLVMPMELLRKMNKRQYKKTMSWLRKCRWITEKKVRKAIEDQMICGSGVFYA